MILSCCSRRWEDTWQRSKMHLRVSQPLAKCLSTSRHVSEVILNHASPIKSSSCPNLVGAELRVKPMSSHSKAYILNSNIVLTSAKCVLFLRALMRLTDLTVSIKTAWHTGKGRQKFPLLRDPKRLYIYQGPLEYSSGH